MTASTLGVMELHVGCAMWTYTPWQGRYLPASLSPRDRLHAYATWCNAVEGNTTFYATPALGTVTSWAGQTAPGFRFILKLPKTITHERRLADVAEPLRAFLAAIEPLGPRAHALWIQLPPSFGPADLGALAGFLRRLPAGHRYCVEVRHRAFFADPRSEQQLERALGDVGAEWVSFDTTVLFGSPPVTDAEREAWTKKPRAAPPVAGPHRLSRRPLHRPGRRGPDRRGLAALARHGGLLAARGALPDRLHPYARQRRRARAGPPVPRRRAGPGPRGRAAPGAGPGRAADPLLSLEGGA